MTLGRLTLIGALLFPARATNGLVYPLRLARRPIGIEAKSGEADDHHAHSQSAIINQWLATDAALRLRKGHHVDVAEMNKYLVGCVGRCWEHGVVELEFETGMKALTCAGEDGPFRMRRDGFTPKHVQMVMIGKTHVWYAQDGKPRGGGGGGRREEFYEFKEEVVENKMKILRLLRKGA